MRRLVAAGLLVLAGCSPFMARPRRESHQVIACNPSYAAPVIDASTALVIGGVGSAFLLEGSERRLDGDDSFDDGESDTALALGFVLPAVLLSASAFYGFYTAKRCTILRETLDAELAEEEAKRRAGAISPDTP